MTTKKEPGKVTVSSGSSGVNNNLRESSINNEQTI